MTSDDGGDQRVGEAMLALMTLIDDELVLVKPEAIARLSEKYYRGDDRNFDSRIIGRALRQLQIDEEFEVKTVRSRGGHSVTTYEPASVGRRKTAIGKAATRKRALYSRYLSWAQGNVNYPSGFLGPAGELAARAGIIESGTLALAQPDAGEVHTILGVHLPGPADSGGYMVPIVGGIPQLPVTVLFEVKNIREWIYPNALELYQVLHKGVILQQAAPTIPIVPILICRAAHITTIYMARALGFLVIDMGTQYIGHQVDERLFNEVRIGLHFMGHAVR